MITMVHDHNNNINDIDAIITSIAIIISCLHCIDEVHAADHVINDNNAKTGDWRHYVYIYIYIHVYHAPTGGWRLSSRPCAGRGRPGPGRRRRHRLFLIRFLIRVGRNKDLQ